MKQSYAINYGNHTRFTYICRQYLYIDHCICDFSVPPLGVVIEDFLVVLADSPGVLNDSEVVDNGLLRGPLVLHRQKRRELKNIIKIELQK